MIIANEHVHKSRTGLGSVRRFSWLGKQPLSEAAGPANTQRLPSKDNKYGHTMSELPDGDAVPFPGDDGLAVDATWAQRVVVVAVTPTADTRRGWALRDLQGRTQVWHLASGCRSR